VIYITHCGEGRDSTGMCRQATLAFEGRATRSRHARRKGARGRAQAQARGLPSTFRAASDLPAGEKGLAEALAHRPRRGPDQGTVQPDRQIRPPQLPCRPGDQAGRRLPLQGQGGREKADIGEDRQGRPAVGGPRQQPAAQVIVWNYLKGTKGEARIALVGKGLTFESRRHLDQGRRRRWTR